MSRVAVKSKIFEWAIDRSGLTLNDLKNKFPRISQWITGEDRPTLHQLESLAKSTFTPLGFFFLEEPLKEKLPVPYFRTLGGEEAYSPSPNLLESIHTMQQRQEWLREYLLDQGAEPAVFVNSVRPTEPPQAVSQKIREALNLDIRWASQRLSWTEALYVLREAMENTGILVVVNGIVGNNTHRKLDTEEFRGFVLVDNIAPLVFVNGTDGRAAQMFTLAHELAHIFFGSSAAFDLREMMPANEPTEQVCNRVAAEFLVPEQQIRQIWPSVRNRTERFQLLAREFKVSEIVAARRSLDLGIIKKGDFLTFYHDYLEKERHKLPPEGGDFYANQNLRIGRRFATAVVRAVKEGRILYSEAYRLTGLYGSTFDRYATSLGMGGA